jgi:undecaprenyl-diphosphatase
MVQGLTEFIPISSTAHLKIVPQALGWGDPGVAFSAAIQLGSIVAVLSYFWADLRQVLSGSVRAIQARDWEALDFRIALGIAIGTLPIVIVGFAVKFFFGEFYDTVVRTSTVVAIVSIVMGLLLGLSEELCKHSRGFEGLRTKDGIIVGLAEALAVIPGVSRSGSTITAGLFLGLDRATAARFSFLLGIPAITLAGLLEVKDLLVGVSNTELMALLAGLISAIVFSYVAIAWLIRFLQTQSTWVFVWYRVAFGTVLLISLSQGWIEN